MLAGQSIDRTRQTDFEFLCDVTPVHNTSEFGGFNTSRSRDMGHSVKPKTNVVYLPLIDMAPAESSTMMTAMVEVQ